MIGCATEDGLGSVQWRRQRGEMQPAVVYVCVFAFRCLTCRRFTLAFVFWLNRAMLSSCFGVPCGVCALKKEALSEVGEVRRSYTPVRRYFSLFQRALLPRAALFQRGHNAAAKEQRSTFTLLPISL